MATEKRMSIRAYAKHRGVDESAVRQAIKDGRLPNGARRDERNRPYIVPDVADAEWLANTNPLYQPKAADKAPRSGKRVKKLVVDGIEILPIDEAKRIQATLQKELTRLDLEAKKGNLVPVDEAVRDVLAAVSSEYTTVRQRLLGIPTRLAPELALVEDAAEVRRLLEAAITEALCELTADAKEWQIAAKPSKPAKGA